MSEQEPPSKRKPPLAVPLTLISLGVTAVVVPIILLRRTRGAASSSVRDLHSASPPPIRRVPGLPSHASSFSAAEGSASPRHHVERQPEVTRAVGLQNRQDFGIQTHSNRSLGGAIYALKALGIATCIVGVSAVAGVLAVRWAMGVQSAEEFAARLRTKIQSLTPFLSSRIYQHHSESSVGTGGGESDEWIWAEAAKRLSKAYEEGGLAQWITVAEKEMELEVNAERKRRARREARPMET